MSRIIRRSTTVSSAEQKALAKAGRTLASSWKSPRMRGMIGPLPGKQDSFVVVEVVQARGDPAVLNEREPRALRFHLAKGSAGIESPVAAIADATKR